MVEPEAVLPNNASCLRLPGTDGKAKMSKSLGNCIYLADDPKVIQQKIMSMYTDPLHLRVEDPGHIEGNTVFTYLDAFCNQKHFSEYFHEYNNLDELKAHYEKGGLGDVKIKRFLNSVIQEELVGIREKRREFEKNIDYVYEILKLGSVKAREVAANTLEEVKKAMKINYFADNEFICEYKKKYNS